MYVKKVKFTKNSVRDSFRRCHGVGLRFSAWIVINECDCEAHAWYRRSSVRIDLTESQAPSFAQRVRERASKRELFYVVDERIVDC